MPNVLSTSSPAAPRPAVPRRPWKGSICVVDDGDSATAKRILKESGLTPDAVAPDVPARSLAERDSFRDRTDPLPWLVVGKLDDPTALHVCAKGAVWCVVEGDKLMRRYVALDESGEYRTWDLGAFPGQGDTLLPTAADGNPRLDRRLRAIVGRLRRFGRAILDWKLALTFVLLGGVVTADDVISDLLRRQASLALSTADWRFDWGEAARDVLLIGFGVAAFAWLAGEWLKVRIAETAPRRRARVLILGLSPLDRLEPAEVDRLDAHGIRPIWRGCLDPRGRLFENDDTPIHPHAASQFDAASKLPLEVCAESADRMVARAKEKGCDEALAHTLVAKPQFPWQQSLRVLAAYLDARRPHEDGFAYDAASPLEHILVVTSEQAQDDYPLFAALLEKKLGDCNRKATVQRTAFSPNVGSIADALKALRDAVDQALSTCPGLREDEIVIDITAAARPFGVAAAVLTMNRDLVFSFVDRDGEVREYDGGVYLARE
jgi:hypothetical protein